MAVKRPTFRPYHQNQLVMLPLLCLTHAQDFRTRILDQSGTGKDYRKDSQYQHYSRGS